MTYEYVKYDLDPIPCTRGLVRMSTHQARRKAAFGRRVIKRLRLPRATSAYHAWCRSFDDQARVAFERLRADPAAWREYLDECAAIDPLLATAPSAA
jgi:hypothetical protein